MYNENRGTYSIRLTSQRRDWVEVIETYTALDGTPLFDCMLLMAFEISRRWKALRNPDAVVTWRKETVAATALEPQYLIVKVKSASDANALVCALEYIHRYGFSAPGYLRLRHRDLFHDLVSSLLAVLLDVAAPALVTAPSGDTTTAPALVTAPAPILDPGAAPAPAPAGDPR